MSLFDKINESITESDNNKSNSSDKNKLNNNVTNNNNLLIQENNKLKMQLVEANKINNRNINEINELKKLIKNYNLQINNLKTSYDENIKSLKSQIDFEKEINDKYLSKIVKSNNDISNDIKNFNEKITQENKELIALVNENKQEISPKQALSTSQDINDLKEYIDKNNNDIINLINEKTKETAVAKKELSEEIISQQNTINEFLSSDNYNIGELFNNEFNHLSDIVTKNTEKLDGTSSEIIEKINEFSPSQNTTDFDEIKSLFITKEEVNNATEKIINEFARKSEDSNVDVIVERVNESLKSYNDDLMESIANISDVTKKDIFNRIADEISRGNLININAYQKIKDLNLFDEAYYRKTYDYNLDIDPLLHFIYKGYTENKKPCEFFDPLFYKQSHDNVQKSSLNPLVYFVTYGINEGNIKINEDYEEVNHINKEDIDEEIKNFTIRGVKKSKRKPRLMVSLTTTQDNINNAHYSLYSLLNQELKADKVILWLNKNDFPNEELDVPKNVLKLKENGLSLRFCEDYKQYNNIIPIITTYPNDIIITANDNVYYPQNWLKILYNDHKSNPDTILAHKAKLVSLKDDNTFNKYEELPYNEDEKNPTYHNLANTEAGVLYPPNTISENICNEKKFNEYDDNINAWLWAMCVLNHKKIKLTKNKLEDDLIYVNPLLETDILNNSNLKQDNNMDTIINNIVNKYPEIINIIKEE